MNPLLVVAFSAGLAVAFPVAGVAADHSAHSHHGAGQSQAQSELALADGVVRKVDRAGGRVTVAHGPLPNGMPPMTMVFKVKESAWLERLKEGQRIRFAAQDVRGEMTIVRLEADR